MYREHHEVQSSSDGQHWWPDTIETTQPEAVAIMHEREKAFPNSLWRTVRAAEFVVAGEGASPSLLRVT